MFPDDLITYKLRALLIVMERQESAAQVSNPKKRKTLHDYFGSNQPIPTLGETVTNHTTSKASRIPGLEIIPSFVTPAEESSILFFLSTQQWRTDLARRVIHYGGTYCLMPPRGATQAERKAIESNIIKADSIPTQLEFIIDKMVESDLYADIARPRYCIVNSYTGTQGISAHVENFRFDEPVCALTLGDGDFMRFHELVEADDGSVRSGKAAVARRTGRREDVWLPARSLLVLKDSARASWQHEIVRRKGKRREGWNRVSLTFRLEKGK
jgi:alkylated DNA repair dioxygenase AlkB